MRAVGQAWSEAAIRLSVRHHWKVRGDKSQRISKTSTCGGTSVDAGALAIARLITAGWAR